MLVTASRPRSPATHTPDQHGVPTFHMHKTRPGRVPPISRERRCPHDRQSAYRPPPAAFQRPVLHPGPTTIHPGLTLTRRHRRFTHVHPSGLPLTCTPGWIEHASVSTPGLCTPPLPAAHTKVGTSHTDTDPGYVIDLTADLQLNKPLAHATSCRTTSKVLLVLRVLLLSQVTSSQVRGTFAISTHRHSPAVMKARG